MNKTALISASRPAHWQIAPAGSGLDIVTNADDVDMCITTILNTPKGSDVTRPEFGSDHFRYLDYPEDVQRPMLVREVYRAIQTWEQRAVLQRVEFSGHAPHLTISIYWRLADGVEDDVRRSDVTVGVSHE